jgi:hypothetical protein
MSLNTLTKPVEILITEEHSSQLHLWHKLGIQDATLIYLDAHLDLQDIGEERILKLKNCRTNTEIAALEKPHHTVPDQGYSYSIEDFLYAAYRLGIIKHVIWVHPATENQQANPMDSIRMLKNTPGFRMEYLTSFEVKDNLLEANLMGLKVTICSCYDLPKLSYPENTIIDIDIDYFITLPCNRFWIDPQVVFEILHSLPVKQERITFTRSVSSGYMPLRYRFIADYLGALWQEDTTAHEHYRRLLKYDSQGYNSNTEAAVKNLLDEVELFPNCAATYYFLSIWESDPEAAQKYLEKAASICPLYKPSVLRDANAIMSRDMEYNRHKLEALEQSLEVEELDKEERRLAHFALGLLYSSLGDKQGTLRHYQACQALQKSCYPLLSLALGTLAFQQREYTEATFFLEQALLDESSQPEAHTILGEIYLDREEYNLAKNHLVLATELLPSAKKPVKLLTALYKKTGELDNYQQELKKYQQMQLLFH